MKSTNEVFRKCSNCGVTFVLGYSGVITALDTGEEVPVCDICAGVKRDNEGNAWLPDQIEKTWEDGTVTTREEAFK